MVSSAHRALCQTPIFVCVAEAVNDLAISTSVDACWVEDRGKGLRIDADPETREGNIAVAGGSTSTGGDDRYQENTWLCWDVSARFQEFVASDSDCKQVR